MRARNFMLMTMALLALSIGISACGGGSDSSSSSTTAESTEEASGATGTVVAEAEKEVEELEDPTGREWPLPTESFNPGKHKVALIDFNFADPSSKQHADGWVPAAKAMGWEYKLFNAEASVPKLAGFIAQATQQGYEAIIWDAVDANSMKAPVETALEKGIAIGCTNCLTKGFGGKILDASSSWDQQGEAVAAWVIAARKGQAKVVTMEDSEFPPAYEQTQVFAKTLEERCPECTNESQPFTVTEVVEDPGPPSWSAVLAQHPAGSLTDVVAAYDFGAVAFIKTAHQQGREDPIISSFQLAPEYAQLLAEGDPLAGVDTAAPQEVTAWASLDQVARQLAGVENWNATELPFVLVSNKNISEFPEGKYTPPDFNYEAEFEKLWE